MPAVWAGRRRGLLIALGALGVFQAILALILALTADALLSPDSTWDRWDIVALIGAALGIGLARWMERVLAEDLGQDYVFEQRRRLLTSAIASPEYRSSLGVTVTRASNDLTSVRNWIALGIVPLVTGIPLIVIVLGALMVLDTTIGLAVAAPLVLIVLLIPALGQVTLSRARNLRRKRGRMSARIADTVMASESVRVSGAVDRELKAADRDSAKVVDAAVDRAWITGLTRALTSTAASLCTVGVVIVSVGGLTDPASVASTLTLLGVLAAPVTELGRVVEYRQNYRAAARILAPLLAQADEIRDQDRERAKAWKQLYGKQHDVAATMTVRGLTANGRRIPDMEAGAGEKIRLVSGDPHHIRATLAKMGSLIDEDIITIGDYDYARAPGKVRRRMLGAASANVPLERGSISRLTSLRVPDATEAEIEEQLRAVGVWKTVQENEKGTSLKLKNGGRPWSSSNTMLLKIARALMATPAVLVLEGVDSLLDADAVARVRQIVSDYPGVVIFSSERPEIITDCFREWDIDGPELVAQTSRDDETLDQDEVE